MKGIKPTEIRLYSVSRESKPLSAAKKMLVLEWSNLRYWKEFKSIGLSWAEALSKEK